MIVAFQKSRRTAWAGGAALALLFAGGAWLLTQERVQTQASRLLLVGLAAFVGVNLALYVARMLAMREYQARLLLLYEMLDPRAMLDAVQPLLLARLDASTRCTTQVHLANAHLYAGDSAAALALLAEVQPPEKALAMRGLVLSNTATCLLAQGDVDGAKRCMEQLRALLTQKDCKKEFVQKARHTLAYLQLCADIRAGKRVSLEPLEKDIASTRAPLHRLDAQYRLACACRVRGDEAGFARARAYVAEHGTKTALPGLLA